MPKEFLMQALGGKKRTSELMKNVKAHSLKELQWKAAIRNTGDTVV